MKKKLLIVHLCSLLRVEHRMAKEETKMLLKMLSNRFLFTILFSGFFMFSTQVSFAQEEGGTDADSSVVDTQADEQSAEEGASATATEGGAEGVPTDEAVIAEGKSLFTANCTVCHAINDRVVGPALKDVTDRRPVPWLISFIKNSQKLIQSGDPVAVKLFEEYNKTPMPNFDYFSDEEVLSILAYVQQESQAAVAAAETPEGAAVDGATSAGAGEQGAISSEYMNLIIGGFIFVLILILVVLVLLVVVLTRFLKGKQDLDAEDREIVERKTEVGKILKSKGFIGLLTFIFVALALRAVIEGLFTVGIQTGYAPTQPIAFSHALHAGQYQIDCNYCHTGVTKSKNANIPSANICMNCHSTITRITGAEEDSKEIQKIYAAIENDQPIEWVRVHNLPDLAYFNHAQHVNVGGVECQTCHGPVEEMEVVRQHSSLTMGWCINCHRETEINGDNEYYDKLVELHATASKEPMTVEDIGGLECSKCHY